MELAFDRKAIDDLDYGERPPCGSAPYEPIEQQRQMVEVVVLLGLSNGRS